MLKFLEVKVLLLNPDQEKDRSHFLDKEVSFNIIINTGFNYFCFKLKKNLKFKFLIFEFKKI